LPDSGGGSTGSGSGSADPPTWSHPDLCDQTGGAYGCQYDPDQYTLTPGETSLCEITNHSYGCEWITVTMLTVKSGDLGPYVVDDTGTMVSSNWKDYYYTLCFPSMSVTSAQLDVQQSPACQAAMAASNRYGAKDPIDFAIEHPTITVGIGIAVGICVTPGLQEALCIPVVTSATMFAGGYTLAKAGTPDWSWDDFGTQIIIGDLVGIVHAKVFPWMKGSQAYADLTADAAYVAIAPYIPETVVALWAEAEAGQLDSLGDVCAVATSWIPGGGSMVTSVACYW
jgi:hypothetical protein